MLRAFDVLREARERKKASRAGFGEMESRRRGSAAAERESAFNHFALCARRRISRLAPAITARSLSD